MADHDPDICDEQTAELEEQIEQLTADRDRLQGLLDEALKTISDAQDSAVTLARALGARI